MKCFFLYLILVSFLIGCSSCSSSKETEKNQTKNITQKTEKTIMADTSETQDSVLVATIKTNMGNIEIELFEKQAPKTVENFVGLAEKGYYKNVIFHRVINNFMIQGGDPTGTGRGGESLWGGKFEDEIDSSLTFDAPGYLAMANAGPNTNGSQFFITTIPTPWLNGKHTIFGKVINGMDVVNKIDKTPTAKPYDRPVKDVVMEEITVEKKLIGTK